MKHFVLATLLLTALAGCKKNDDTSPAVLLPPTPKPTLVTLQARWQVDSSWVSKSPSYNGIKSSVEVYPPSQRIIEFTGAECITYSKSMLANRLTYTLKNNVISYGGNGSDDQTIQVLGQHRLVLVALRNGLASSNEYIITTASR
jgi:hypothetical protein